MTPPGRNRYADLLRVAAIVGVIYGHWLLTAISYRNGRLSGADALDFVPWGRWVTWLFQVLPVFFLVGGYVNARSWLAHHARGETWTQWMRDRVLRLLWPTAVYLAVAGSAAMTARAAGVRTVELAQAGWLVALHLWFLPVYMIVTALSPLAAAAHRRWGLAVPAALAVAAVLVDVAKLGIGLRAVGDLNYLLVWGGIHQWGIGWQDRSLTLPRRRLLAMTGGGAVALAALLASRHFKVDMVGSGNTNPPSVALLAFAAAECGLVLLAEPRMSLLLSGARAWNLVRRLNALAMNAYLWHMAPVVVIAVACYPTGFLPRRAIGSADWFALRFAWFALLTVVLVPLVVGVTWAERPMLGLPAGLGRRRWWSPALLAVGILAASAGLSQLAVNGFAPGGQLPALPLALCAAGLLAALFTGRPAPATGPQAGNAGQQSGSI